MPRLIDWIMLPAVIIGTFLASIPFYPALKLPSRTRAVAVTVLIALLSCAVLLISAEHPVLRFVASLYTVACCVKLFDLHVGAQHGSYPGPAQFVGFLLNPGHLVYRKLNELPVPSTRENLQRLLAATVKLTAAGALFYGVFQIDWRAWPFFVEHCVKVLSFFLVVIPLSDFPCVGCRLMGGRATDFMEKPMLARTPAQFWQRYNRMTQQFFYEDVFLPFRGSRFPLRGLAIVFIVSALVHEVLFTIVLGKVQGYQTAFFLIQGVAVALTWRVRPRGLSAVVWWAGTLLFNLTSGMLFFASVNEMLPFYVSRG